MDALKNFIAIWKRDKNIEALLAAGLDIPAASDIRQYLAALDDKTREESLEILAEAAEAIEAYAAQLQEEADAVKGEIQSIPERSKALLAYNLRQFKPVKKS